MRDFYLGLHQPSDSHRFSSVCISVRRIWGRKKKISSYKVLVDSGAFTEINLYGEYRTSVDDYALELHRLYTKGVVNISAAVAQDYMCEPFMLEKTGMTVKEHQKLTIERYDLLISKLNTLFSGDCPITIIPVLQGYDPEDYISHTIMYGDRLKEGMWVGVGSVCKRNGTPEQILEVLSGIKNLRPDLKLHGFGVKLTSLSNINVKELLDTADSMAWSYSARKKGRDGNSWQEAQRFLDKIERIIE